MPVHEDCLLRKFLNFCVRSSGARPRHRAKDYCCGWAHYLVHLLTTAAWYSTWSSIVWGLHSPTNAARRPQFTMQTALQHHDSSNNLYRGRNCCTTHASKATSRYFLGTRLCLPRRVTLERVPTDWYFFFSACGVDMLPPRPSPLRHSHPVGIEILF